MKTEICTENRCDCAENPERVRCLACGIYAPDVCNRVSLHKTPKLNGWFIARFPYVPLYTGANYMHECTKLCPDCGAKAMLLIREMNAPRAIGHTKNKRFL